MVLWGFPKLFSICSIINLLFLIPLTWYMRDYMLMEKKDQPISKSGNKEALHEHPLKTLFPELIFCCNYDYPNTFLETYNLGLGLIDIFFKAWCEIKSF